MRSDSFFYIKDYFKDIRSSKMFYNKTKSPVEVPIVLKPIIDSLKEEIKNIRARLLMLECDHSIIHRIFSEEVYRYYFGISKCGYCQKTIKYYTDQIDYKRDYVKCLQDRIDIENKSISKTIASQGK